MYMYSLSSLMGGRFEGVHVSMSMGVGLGWMSPDEDLSFGVVYKEPFCQCTLHSSPTLQKSGSLVYINLITYTTTTATPYLHNDPSHHPRNPPSSNSSPTYPGKNPAQRKNPPPRIQPRRQNYLRLRRSPRPRPHPSRSPPRSRCHRLRSRLSRRTCTPPLFPRAQVCVTLSNPGEGAGPAFLHSAEPRQERPLYHPAPPSHRRA